MNEDDKLRQMIYLGLVQLHQEIRKLEVEILTNERKLNNDGSYRSSKPDENWWIKAPFRTPKQEIVRDEYYEAEIIRLNEMLKPKKELYDRYYKQIDIKTDIIDRIFYYKYIEELSYKELVNKTPLSESRFNVYLSKLKEILKKGVKEE